MKPFIILSSLILASTTLMAQGKIVQTARRTQLGTFAPEFAHFNDDVLFGENWNNHDIDLKTRTMITVVALAAPATNAAGTRSRNFSAFGTAKFAE